MVLLGYTWCHFDTTNAVRCMILTSPALQRSGIATSVEWIWDISQPVHWNVTFLCFYSWVAATTTGCSPSNFKASLPAKLSGLGATLSGDQKRTRWHCGAQVECVDPMLGWPGPFEEFENTQWFRIRCLSLIRLNPNIFSSGLALGQLEERKSVLHVEGRPFRVSIYSTAHNWAKLHVQVCLESWHACVETKPWWHDRPRLEQEPRRLHCQPLLDPCWWGPLQWSEWWSPSSTGQF